MAACAAFGPYDHDHPICQEACADPANFAVIRPVVDHRHGVTGKHLLGINCEIESPMDKVQSRLTGSKVISMDIYVTT
jgi:hypothetical protein